ncbi:MAG: hypothetical protein HY705_08095, partial [Gemmatimonadetes bacterium]|nr:hypothetical protein [Gemmatimonadota bacterium]
TDLLTGQTLPELERGPITKATAVPRCWLHRGVVYAVYPDRKVAKFTLQGGGTIAQETATPPVTAQPQAALALKRLGGDFTQGVWLDGRTPVDFEAVLTDDKGAPMAGVIVHLEVLDRTLPTFGRTAPLGSTVTDAQGRVRGRYVPPRVADPSLARRAPAVSFKASAQPRQGPPIEVFENAPAYPLLAGFLRVSRAGYLPLDQFPVELPSLRLGTVQGRVVFRASSTRFDSSASPAVERSSGDYRVAGAKVELMAEGRKIAEATTDGAGAFQITLSPASAGPPSVALPDPIALTQYEAEVGARLLRVRRTLATLADPKYGYKVDRIQNAVASFHARFALAATEAAVEAEADALQRIGLLVAAISASHELAEDSADRIIDTIATIVADLVDVWDPGMPGQDKVGELAKTLAPNAVAMIK